MAGFAVWENESYLAIGLFTYDMYMLQSTADKVCKSNRDKLMLKALHFE